VSPRGRGLLLALLAGSLAAPLTWAQGAYVAEGLRLGVHQENRLDSPVIELLPSGTALEVLQRDGPVARVRLEDGREGWVDGDYLSESEPGAAQVLQMEAQLTAARAKLAESQAQVVALEEELAAQAERLQRRESSAGNDSPAVSTNTGGAIIPSQTLREMQVLAEENQALKQQVAELQAVQQMAVEKAQAAEQALARARAAPGPVAPQASEAGFSISRWERWQQILLVSALLLAFAAGGWLVDWGIRRRHGGFRV
jgi:SH3 domain protein